MSAGLYLLLVLVVVSALAAMKVDTGPAEPCEWHDWEWNNDAASHICTKCELIAGEYEHE